MQVGDFSIGFADGEMFLNRKKSLLPDKTTVFKVSALETTLILETLLSHPEYQERAVKSLTNKKLIGIDGNSNPTYGGISLYSQET